MERFEDNDGGYLTWTRHNPSGYVLNVQRGNAPSGVMLHRARCFTIHNESFRGSGWTRNAYVKVCSHGRETLRKWALRHTGRLPPDCLKCRP